MTDADRARLRTVLFHACLGNGQIAVVTDAGYRMFEDFVSAKKFADDYLATVKRNGKARDDPF